MMPETRATISERLRVRARGLKRWVARDFVTWIREPRRGWITIGVAIVAYVVVWTYPAAVEPRVRWLGMFFQLLGVGTVALGIKEVRRLFDKPSLRTWTREWLQRFPSLREKHATTTAAAGGGGGAISFSGHGLGTVGLGPDAGLQERITKLEKDFLWLLGLLGQYDQRARAAHAELAAVDAREQDDRSKVDAELNRKLEESAIGGIALEVMGLVWLTLGIVLASTSVEIAHYFPRFFPPLS